LACISRRDVDKSSFFQSRGQILNRKGLSLDLLLYDRDHIGWKQQRESSNLRAAREDRRTVPRMLFDESVQQSQFDEWHIASEKQFPVRTGGKQGRIDAAQRSAAWDAVATNGPHREARLARHSPDQRQHRDAAQFDRGFIPAHPSAEAARQNANADCRG
jgi:hypothetical protein